MPETATRDPRIPLIAAVLAIGETPEGRELCERFLKEAASLGRDHAPTFREAWLTPGVAHALEGIVTGLTMAADHAAFIAVSANRIKARSPAG